jgi:O-antigen ligase
MLGERAGRAPEVATRPALSGRTYRSALFLILALFTLTTGDGGPVPQFVLTGSMLALTAVFCWTSKPQGTTYPLPVVVLLGMTAYGLLQTIFFPQKIVYEGWTGVLFWFTAAVITWMASQLLRSERHASRFHLWFIVFGTSICLLDLLQQASQTNKYFWLIPSRYETIFGPFAYWNNFAQFVELLLPVTLWRGLGSGRVELPLLLCAAVQIGSVVASGSRAGTALVALELVVLLAFAYRRNRNRALLAGAAAAIALSVIFIYAAGIENLITKLQQNDQLTVRRNIDRSSLAMIRARPLTGWGLNTYVPVYRMFARYDDGTYVNRAHNDWLEWAAEGGILFAAAMLVVFVWSIRPAIRAGWAIGLIAICLHALVDYPFARFGVCAWYFCLLGVLGSRRTLPESP